MPKKKNKRRNSSSINIDDILLKNRNLFLFNTIDEKTSKDLIRELITLDHIKKDTITLTINSEGGSVSAGLAIIDVIKTISSPVNTIIIGEACSMAGIISIIGKKRYMTKNAIWMGHPMAGGYVDYLEHVKDFTKAMETWEEMVVEIFKTYTKLTSKDLDKMTRGQLWLTAQQALKKGVIDKIL